jgi:hypothetical protein
MPDALRTLRPSRSTIAAASAAAAATAKSDLADGQAQSHKEAFTNAVEAGLRQPRYRQLAGAQDAARLANAIMECLDPPGLDFTSLPEADARLLATLPAEIWAALRRLVTAQSGSDITSVTLSAALSTELVANADQTLTEGLGRLACLTHLTIVDPPRGTIDLAQPRTMPESLAYVQIRCPAGPKQWDLHVAQRVEVIAAANAVATEKSTVTYYGSDGQRGEQRSLAGIIYHNQPKSWALHLLPQDIRLNGNAAFAGRDDLSPDERKIWCRHLAIHWLRARQENRSTDAPFDYGPFTSIQSLSADMKPSLQDDNDRIVAGGTDALFSPDKFGKLLATQFERMQVGQTKQFIVNTPNHALALELRVKTAEATNGVAGPIEYVVNLYDPNFTALHQRLMVPKLDLLRAKGLADWMSPGAMTCYFPANEDSVGMLYSWFEVGETRPEPCATDFIKHLADELRLSPRVIFMALTEGRTQDVSDTLDLALEHWRCGSLDSASLARCIAAISDGIPGLAAAVAFGSLTAVELYVGWVLNVAPDVLTAAQRVELLLAALEDGQPGLYLTASEEMAEERASQITESIFSYVHAIVASPNLSAQDKAMLCASAHDGRTAAQSALANNNPAIAAAIVCAIFEAESDPGKRVHLLASLGVSLRDVLAAQTEEPYPKLADWVELHERDATRDNPHPAPVRV